MKYLPTVLEFGRRIDIAIMYFNNIMNYFDKLRALTVWALRCPTLSVRHGLPTLYEEAHRGLCIFYERAQVEQTEFSLENILIATKINYVVIWKALITVYFITQ